MRKNLHAPLARANYLEKNLHAPTRTLPARSHPDDAGDCDACASRLATIEASRGAAAPPGRLDDDDDDDYESEGRTSGGGGFQCDGS